MRRNANKNGDWNWINHITVLLLSLALIIGVFSTARAGSTSISPDGIYVETKTDLSTGSRLCWTWQSAFPVQFTVVRSSDSATPLYEKTASSDSAELVVQKDDTYLLLWLNPNNVSVSLNFTVTVEAGFGSFSLFIAIIFVLIFILIFVFIIRRRRKTKGPEKEGSQSGHSETQIQSNTQTVEDSPPSLPVEMSQIPRGTRYCPICSSPVPREGVYCINCGSRLDSR